MQEREALKMMFKMLAAQIVIGKRDNIPSASEPISMCISCAKDAGLTKKEIEECLSTVEESLFSMGGISIKFTDETPSD